MAKGRNTATFWQLSAQWLDLVASDLSPTTLHRYRNLLKNRILLALGDKSIQSIRTSDLDRLYFGLIKEVEHGLGVLLFIARISSSVRRVVGSPSPNHVMISVYEAVATRSETRSSRIISSSSADESYCEWLRPVNVRGLKSGSRRNWVIRAAIRLAWCASSPACWKNSAAAACALSPCALWQCRLYRNTHTSSLANA